MSEYSGGVVQVERAVRPRYLIPNPGLDRSWSRKKWEESDRYCRIVGKVLAPEVERITSQAMIDFALYGTMIVRMTA